jgi:hypothetical protein
MRGFVGDVPVVTGYLNNSHMASVMAGFGAALT